MPPHTMELALLQKKYPEFVYDSCDWNINGPHLTAVFCFRMGEIEFNPLLTIRNIDKRQIEKIGGAAVSNLVFNMGLAEIPSYWKAACPPKIIVKAGYLDKRQVSFWQDLIFNMGQFFYENNLPFIKPDFIIAARKPKKNPVIAKKFSSRCLIPLGGGKDSLVTLELLMGSKKETAAFTLNANAALNGVVAAAGARNIFVERKIDRKLVEMNAQGYLNGHTPFSSILSVLGVGLAALFDFKSILMSQERSSEEGNVEYRGKKINHQYSKTLEFENKFRRYSNNYLAKNIEYFSFLRPLYEIQITEIFSRHPEYFGVFLSCNKPFTIAARESGSRAGWCGRCSKCLSVFAMIYPFAGREAAAKIFGGNLFENKNLLPVMVELLGQANCKPMECVGTFGEMRAAFYLSLRATGGDAPFLLEYFKENILPKYPRLETETGKIMTAWTSKHNIPGGLAAILKKNVLHRSVAGCG